MKTLASLVVLLLAGCAPAPVTLVSGLSAPNLIVVDSTSVYWSTFSSGLIQKAPLGGGAPVTLVSGQSPFAMVNDGSFLYWADVSGPLEAPVGTVKKVALAGGEPIDVATGLKAPSSIAIDDTNVYWVDSGEIARAPKAGGAAVTLFTGQLDAIGLAVDATHLYWTVKDPELQGSVMRGSLGGGDPVALASGQFEIAGVGVSGGEVGWYGSNGLAGSVATDGNAVRSLASDCGSSSLNFSNDFSNGGSSNCSNRSMAIDHDNIYWADCGHGTDGKVQGASLTGGGTFTLSSGGCPIGVTVDAQNVYWTELGTLDAIASPGGSTSTVKRVAK